MSSIEKFDWTAMRLAHRVGLLKAVLAAAIAEGCNYLGYREQTIYDGSRCNSADIVKASFP